MSFLMPSQRGVSQQPLPLASAPIHSQPPRSHLPLSSFQAFPHDDAPAPPPPSMPAAYATDSISHFTTKNSETRCYWSLLSADLHFIYLDPVLTSHLEDQADLLIGKSLLNFVHPEEQASARADLTEALEQRTMHGTVTRVRYCRLSRVRRFLGYTGPLPHWTDGDKIALDNHYLAVDIVISWAAEGLVLCFIHAVADLVPADNDEHHKTPWSNWCGTPAMHQEQLSLLDQRLRCYCPQPGLLTRVFQILSNSSAQNFKVLFSWPPDSSHEYSNKPSAKVFAKSASAVQTSTHDNSAKTSCTRRWRIVGTLPNVVGDVESVFIPHGTIMFACHTIQNSGRNSVGTSATPSYAVRPHDGYTSHHAHHSYDVSSSSSSSSPYTLPPVTNTPSPSYGHFVGSLPSYSSPPWSGHPETSPFLGYNRWPQSASPTHTLSSLSAPCSLRETSYGTQSSARPSESPHYGETRGPHHAYQPTPSPDLDYADRHRADNIGMSISSPTDVVPPPRHRISPGTLRDGASGRNSNRPVGILRCTSCKVTSSPEWRKGPSGKKELCNACGLRYARSRAKKEGHVATGQRRKKERAAAVKEEGCSQSSPIAIADSGTRGSASESASFASTSSVGSASGSDVYSQHSPLAHEPSPSPPSGALNFVHYSHPPPPPPSTHGLRSEGRLPFHASTSGFHPTPSPLSNAPSHRAFRSTDESAMSSARLAPFGYVSSTGMTSGGNGIAPLSSFERDKTDERHYMAPSGDKRYPMQR